MRNTDVLVLAVLAATLLMVAADTHKHRAKKQAAAAGTAAGSEEVQTTTKKGPAGPALTSAFDTTPRAVPPAPLAPAAPLAPLAGPDETATTPAKIPAPRPAEPNVELDDLVLTGAIAQNVPPARRRMT